ncbi:MAG TPA: GNAT family N-acetyltransferase [Nocardioidaceae bacterium]|nr:GNAT family N-acetyltransferase [Nocardioidaceae bacterium]
MGAHRRASDAAGPVRVISPAPRDAWVEVLASDPDATIQQAPAWFEAVLQTGRATDVSRLYQLPDGRRLVLPLARREPVAGLAFDASHHASFGAGGVLASGGLRDSDLRHVLTDLRRSRAVSTRLTGSHHTADRWRAAHLPGVLTIPRRSEVLDLSGGFEKVFGERFQSSVRRAVRKAERSGLTVECGTGSGSVQVFYDLYLEWTERRAQESGLPRGVALALARRREPLSKFQTVAEMLQDHCRVWVAAYDGEAVAGIITLAHGDHATYWRGYSRKEVAGPLRANVLLQRLAIEQACEAGCRYYDFGQSGGVAALERFKQTFGATPRESVELRLERLPVTRLQQLRGRAEAQVSRQLSRRTAAGPAEA